MQGNRFLVWSVVNPWKWFRGWLNRSRFVAFVVGLTIGVTFTYCYIAINVGYKVVIYNSSPVEVAKAATVEKETAQEKKKETPVELVRRYFGKNADDALKIMQCESLGEDWRIGDENLSFWNDGELLGRSIGLFQIRTGGMSKNGKIWNRARANGMTVEAFEEKMKNPEENVKYAYSIFKADKWEKWSCNGVLK